MLRIFVGSTHRDLATERLLVQEVLESFAKETEGLSYFAPRSQPPVDAALSAIQNSDAAIFILGHCYGAMAPGQQFSHAELEYQAAIQQRIPIFAFLRQDDFGMLPGQFEKEPARVAKVRAFRDQLRQHAVTFTDAPSLAVVVRKALEIEISKRGLIKKFPTRSIPKASFSIAPTKSVDQNSGLKHDSNSEPAPESPTRTLPIFQKALSTPFSNTLPGSRSLRLWGVGSAVAIVAIIVGIMVWRSARGTVLPTIPQTTFRETIAPKEPAPVQIEVEVKKSPDTIMVTQSEDSASMISAAALRGDQEAQFQLGRRYELGQGFPHNDSLAFKFYRLAAKQGHAEAQYRLALCYQKGRGVTRSRNRAREWLTAASMQGFGAAQSALGQIFLKGDGTVRNPAEGYKWLLRAAEKKDSTAIHILAELKQEE